MDFASSSNGVNTNVKTVSAGSNGFNFKSSGMGFSANINNVSIENVNKIHDDYEEIDYAKGMGEEAIVPIASTEVKPGVNDDQESTIFTEKFVTDKGINVGLWAATKWGIAHAAEGLTKSDNGMIAVLGLGLVAVAEGGYKSLLRLGSDKALDEDKIVLIDDFWKGVSKSLGSTVPKNWESVKNALYAVPGVKKMVSQSALTKIAAKAKGGIVKRAVGAVKKTSAYTTLGNVFTKANSILSPDQMTAATQIRVFKNNSDAKGFFRKLGGTMNGTTKTYGEIVSGMKLGIAIDFGASLLSNAIGGCFDDSGEFALSNFEVSDLKVGSSFLKSTTKLIFATAGEMAFGKAGKYAGSAVGAFIAEVQVAAFTDDNGKVQEGWCAAAGAVELAGAVIAGAVIVACMSNPAGWVVGIAMIAGAAIGYGLVVGVHAIVENWGDEIVGALKCVGSAIVAGANFVAEVVIVAGAALVVGAVMAAQSVIEFGEAVVSGVVAVAEGVIEFGGAVIDGVAAVAEGVVEFGEAVVEVIDNVGEAIKSNRITNFLLGWAF